MNWRSKQLWIGLALAVVVAVGAYTWFSGRSGVSEELSGSLGAGLGNSGVAEISGTANTGNLNIGQNEIGVPGTQCSGIYDQDRCEDDSECNWERVNTRRQPRPGEQIPHECVADTLTGEPAPTPATPASTNCSSISTSNICQSTSGCRWDTYRRDASIGNPPLCITIPNVTNRCAELSTETECGTVGPIRGCMWRAGRCEFYDDKASPTVNINAPAHNTSVSGSVTVRATASDQQTAIKQVEFFIDDQRRIIDTSNPYSMTWDTTQTAPGVHKIKAKALDEMNNAASVEITVTVSTAATATPVNNVSGTLPDTTLPVVRITAPTEGATVTSSVTVTAEATDASGIAKVEFSIDGTWKQTVYPPALFNMVWDTTKETNASHRIAAAATDTAGKISPPSIKTFIVANSAPPVQPGQLPAAIVTVAASSTANSDATATPGQTDIDLGSFTLTGSADAKFKTIEFTKTGSTPNSALSSLALKKADGSTLGFEQRVTSAGKVRFNFAETNLGTTPQTFKLTASLSETAPPETNFTFSLQAQPGSLAEQAQDVTLANVPFALRKITIPAAAVTPDETQKTLSVLAGRPARSTDTNLTAGEAKDLAVLELTFTNGQPLEPISVDGLTLRFTGTLPVTKLSDPVFYSGATGRPLPGSQATVTRDPRNGDIIAEFTGFAVDLQTSLILYVKVSTNSADSGKTIQYALANIETDQSVDVEIENAGSPTFTVATAATDAPDDAQQAAAAQEEARKSEEVRKAAEEAKKAAEAAATEAKKALEEVKKAVAKKKPTNTNSGGKAPVDRQLADAMAATATVKPSGPAPITTAAQTEASQRGAAYSSGLEGSQRITRAPERGNTGPGVGIYFAILGVVQAGRLIRKKLGKK